MNNSIAARDQFVVLFVSAEESGMGHRTFFAYPVAYFRRDSDEEQFSVYVNCNGGVIPAEEIGFDSPASIVNIHQLRALSARVNVVLETGLINEVAKAVDDLMNDAPAVGCGDPNCTHCGDHDSKIGGRQDRGGDSFVARDESEDELGPLDYGPWSPWGDLNE